jgi:capsular exopolysaccharide synthesis family protein
MSRIFEARLKAKCTVPVPEPELNQVGDSIRLAEAGAVTPRLSPILAQFVSPEGPWFEQIRTLIERIRVLEQDNPFRSVGFVSTAAGEGKTTIATALSLILSQEPNNRVILVDADLRKGDIARNLGLEEECGLADWLANPNQEVPVRRIKSTGTFVLSSGRVLDRPWELVASPWLKSLMTTLHQNFDYVIIDCPPLGLVADAARVQDLISCLLLVVRSRSAPREMIKAVTERLKHDKIKGLILNDIARLRSRSYNYEYNAYYHQRASVDEDR